MQTTTTQNELAIPTEILDAAQQLAGKLGLSSNKLFATALSDFIRRYGEIEITAELDKVYSDTRSTLDPVLSAMQFRSLPAEKWQSYAEKFGGRTCRSRWDQRPAIGDRLLSCNPTSLSL